MATSVDMAVNLLTTDREFTKNPMSVCNVNANCHATGKPVQLTRRQCSDELAKMYTPAKRMQERVCVTVCLVFIVVDAFFIFLYLSRDNFWNVLLGGFFGALCADFGSGLVHWVMDTWGSVDFPIIGQHLLRNFREHHIDPTSITRHDFIETNGDNFAVGIPFLLHLTWYLLTTNSTAIQANISWICFIYLLVLLIAMTNQIHKWSHTYFGLPRIVVLLQNCHLILPRLHHRHHHVAPHETYYCITTGWLNWPLEQVRFWTVLEFFVEKVTGCQPRTDDLRWAQMSSFGVFAVSVSLLLSELLLCDICP